MDWLQLQLRASPFHIICLCEEKWGVNFEENRMAVRSAQKENESWSYSAQNQSVWRKSIWNKGAFVPSELLAPSQFPERWLLYGQDVNMWVYAPKFYRPLRRLIILMMTRRPIPHHPISNMTVINVIISLSNVEWFSGRFGRRNRLRQSITLGR